MKRTWRFVRVGMAAAFICSVAARTVFPQQLFLPESSLPQPMHLAVEMLSATHGVYFKDYLDRLETSVKRNWYEVMPESALLGKKGIVTLALQIWADGSIRAKDPKVESASRTEEFNKAAVDAVRNAAPFERLPDLAPQNIRLRITFYYNLPTEPKRHGTHQSKGQISTKLMASSQHLPV